MSEVTGRYTLKRPLTVTLKGPDGEREEQIAEVTIRPLDCADDLRCMDGHEGEVAKSIALVAHLSGLTVRQVGKLHPADFAALAEKAEGFTPPGLPIGETSSAI